MWVLTNKKLKEDFSKNHSFEGYSLYSNSVELTKGSNSDKWLTNGYWTLKQNDISDNQQDSLSLNILFLKYGNKFIEHVKGNFVIINLQSNQFSIYSDVFSIQKFFYWQSKDQFILSDNLNQITREIDLYPSAESIAIYSLCYHFCGGKTIFEDVSHNTPGQKIEFKNGRLNISSWVDHKSFLANKSEFVSIDQFATTLDNSIQDYLSKIDPPKISLSLTSGVDSRLLFSILLKKDIPLHTYTYGNKNSIDCAFADRLASIFDIEHEIYDIEFSEELFKKYARKSVELGQSLGSLHRAHRVAAHENEAKYADTMILGTMGGEFVKGADHDDYIISDFVYEFSQNQEMAVLIKHLEKKGIRLDKIDIDYLLEFFRSQNWCKFPVLIDFYALIEIAASLHHSQNNIQYSNYIKNILTPFMDLEYLELLFKSQYNFLNKKKLGKYFRRLENHKFSSDLQTYLSAELSRIPYNSGFQASEYKVNKYYALIKSRIRKKRWNYKPNFPLDKWMYNYTRKELQSLNRNDHLLKETFNIPELIYSLENSKIVPKEAFWLKYTTPIQMKYLLELY